MRSLNSNTRISIQVKAFFLLLLGLLSFCKPPEGNSKTDGKPEQKAKIVAQVPVKKVKKKLAKPKKKPLTPCDRFDRLNTLVRDGKIRRTAAKDSIRKLLPLITQYFHKKGGKNYPRSQWVFPIQGYSKHFIGGKNGEGYVPQGYNYFDGNQHGGHPSHDIFVYDHNQDNIDDNTRKPVNTLAMGSGIVIAYDPTWKQGSELEGGHYLWIFDPGTQGIFYYAHNSKLFVKPGDIVKPGQRIAWIGRTGKSASEKRSPTHLHITYLKVKPDGSLPPEDLYPDLLKCRAIR